MISFSFIYTKKSPSSNGGRHTKGFSLVAQRKEEEKFCNFQFN